MADDYSYDGFDDASHSHPVDDPHAAAAWNGENQPAIPETNQEWTSEQVNEEETAQSAAEEYTATYEETLADAELDSSPAPPSTISPSKQPPPSRLPLPVHKAGSTPMTPQDAAAASNAASTDSSAAPSHAGPESPRRTGALNPTLARLNKNIDALKARGAQMAQEHDERISARAHTEPPPPPPAASIDVALTPSSLQELNLQLKRELTSTKTKLSHAFKQIEELKKLREEDALRTKKVQRNDRDKLDAQQLANAQKKIEIYKKANEVYKNQINSSLNPEKYSSLMNRISESESYAAALSEENKTLKSEMRRLSKEFEHANEQAGDAPTKIAAGLEEIRQLREKCKNYQIQKDAYDKRARKQQEQVINEQEKCRKLQGQIVEFEKRIREMHHQARSNHAAIDANGFIAPLPTYGSNPQPLDHPSPPHILTKPHPPPSTTSSTTTTSSSSGASKKKKAPRGPSGVTAPLPLMSMSKDELDGRLETEAREKQAEARLAQGIRSVASTARHQATKKKPTQLGKLSSTEPSNKPITPQPPQQPKPKTTKATAANPTNTTATTETASTNETSSFDDEPTSSAAAPAVAPEDTTPSWLRNSESNQSSSTATTTTTTTSSKKDEFDVDAFLGLDKKTTTTTTTTANHADANNGTADPYASKPKHKSDTASPTTAPTPANTNASNPTRLSPTPPTTKKEDSMPAWLKGAASSSSSSSTANEEKSSSPTAATTAGASSTDSTPAWLKSSSSSSPSVSSPPPAVLEPVKPSGPAPAPSPAIDIGGRRARGPNAVAAATATSSAKSNEAVETNKPPAAAAATTTTAPTAPKDDVPSWLKSSAGTSNTNEEKKEIPDWMKPTTVTSSNPAPKSTEDEYGDDFEISGADF